MTDSEFNDLLSSIVDEDFRHAIKAVAGCRSFVKAGFSVDEILADNLYYVCKRFVDDYQRLLNGK